MADNADKDERVMAVVSIALRRSSAERELYLRAACESDESLYREAVELVKRQERLGSFMEHSLVHDQPRPLEVGEVISNRFEILREIGEGGMGFVYEAFDRKRNQRIAIKAAKPGFHRLLSPELQGALQVRHPNVCLVNEIHTTQTAHGEIDFLTMERLEGETLAARLIAGGKLPHDEAFEIALQICSGLAAAHESGVVHRDLKPGNIMLCRTANEGLRVVIMDFGLAGAVALDANEGGTPGYMAPELSKGEKASFASDIYSLGVILYQIVTGRLPIQENPSDPDKPSHFVAPSSLTKELDSKWDQVVLSCLAASPALRPSNARKMIAALKLDGEKERSEKQTKGMHNRILLWLLPSAAILVGLATAIWYLRRPLPPLRVAEYSRITHDGHLKDLVGTDGSRLYFNQDIDLQPIAQVAITGGEIAPISVPLPGPWLNNISPDGSSLIVSSFDGSRLDLWNFQVPGGSIRPLTGAWVSSPDWSSSPDNKFVSYVDSNEDIDVARSDGTDVRRLVAAQDHTGNSQTRDINWSPDGSVIRFTRNHRFWEVSSNGSDLHPLLPDWHLSSWQCCGRWTPDGKFFVFLLQETFHQPALAGSQLWVLDQRRGPFRRAPSEPVQLSSGPIQWATPVPSKDGKKIFARGIVLRGELVRFDAKSKQLQPYLGGISAEFVSFSPDGRSMAYVTFPEGLLWRANRDGSNPVQLTDPPIYPLNPRWSPDSANILFFTYGSENDLQSYIVPSQGGSPKLLIPGDSEVMVDSNYSPDGRKIVFTSREAAGGSFTRVLRVLDLASHQIATLPGSRGMRSPQWSPNGRFIAGLSSSGGIMLFNVESQRWSELEKGGCGFPAWSQNSQFIYFVRNWEGEKDPGVHRVRVSGGAAERVVDLKGFRRTGAKGFWFGLDPTDTPMLIRDAGTDDIYALTLEQ